MTKQINILSTKKLLPNQKQELLDADFSVIEEDFIETKIKNFETKDLLTENGFNVIAYTGYASDLAEIISLIYAKESFTFFSGNLRRDVLPKTLKENGITFNEIEVYETKITSKKITHKLDGILFFSPSAVESYLKLNTIKEEICFCIGETTAEALENKKIKNIIIADKPSVENVIAEVLEYSSPLTPDGGNLGKRKF